jgi:hypothetical protein
MKTREQFDAVLAELSASLARGGLSHLSIGSERKTTYASIYQAGYAFAEQSFQEHIQTLRRYDTLSLVFAIVALALVVVAIACAAFGKGSFTIVSMVTAACSQAASSFCGKGRRDAIKEIRLLTPQIGPLFTATFFLEARKDGVDLASMVAAWDRTIDSDGKVAAEEESTPGVSAEPAPAPSDVRP